MRKLLVHGARSVENRAKSKTDSRRIGINNIVDPRGQNKDCVAVANNNARVIWFLITQAPEYKKAV